MDHVTQPLREALALYLPPYWEVWTMEQAYKWNGYKWPEPEAANRRRQERQLVIAGVAGEPGRLRTMEMWIVHGTCDADGPDHWRFGARHEHRRLALSTSELALDAVRRMLSYTGVTRYPNYRTYPPHPPGVDYWHADGRMLGVGGRLLGIEPQPTVTRPRQSRSRTAGGSR